MDQRVHVIGGLVFSLCVHTSILLVLRTLPGASPAAALTLEFDAIDSASAPTPKETAGGVTPNLHSPQLRYGGATPWANIDAQRSGGRGNGFGSSEVVLLLPRSEEVTLQDSPQNTFGVSQFQRIRTSNARASLEDRRATPNPSDTPFLASGVGQHPERRPVATVDPAMGARNESLPSTRAENRAGTNGTREPQSGAPDSHPRGMIEARGSRVSNAAQVATGRPPVDRGPAATAFIEPLDTARDNRDAERLAAQMQQSFVDSTLRRGVTIGRGTGGVGGQTSSGDARGSEDGGRARAFGPGSGDADALDTRDPRYLRWVLDVRRRVERALIFPRERLLRVDQGTSLFRIIVERDGRIRGEPQLVRSSGFSDFDQAALAAIQSARPLPPVPDELAPGRPHLTIPVPVYFANPMIR